MQLTVLGCHAPFPAAGGATPGYLLQAAGKKILLDCGSGVLAQLAKIMPLYEVDGVILSHLHLDHISDLFVLQYAIMVAVHLQQREKRLPIWTPAQPYRWFSMLEKNPFTETHVIKEGLVIQLAEQLSVQFYQTDHAIPCYAMKIKEGERTLLYGADSGLQTDWAKMEVEPDLFICEASFLHQDLPAGRTGHLSARQAAQAAVSLRAKSLLLTHLYPEYDPGEIEQEAAAIFAGALYVAKTGFTYRVGE
jgi:ribonuclease BN (tRNA processing enzyme)